jgi:hypothetical protein
MRPPPRGVYRGPWKIAKDGGKFVGAAVVDRPQEAEKIRGGIEILNLFVIWCLRFGILLSYKTA